MIFSKLRSTYLISHSTGHTVTKDVTGIGIVQPRASIAGGAPFTLSTTPAQISTPPSSPTTQHRHPRGLGGLHLPSLITALFFDSITVKYTA